MNGYHDSETSSDALRTPAIWRLVDDVIAMPGYIHGFRYPSMMLTVEGGVFTEEMRDRFWKALKQICPHWGGCEQLPVSIECNWPQSLEWLLLIWQQLQVAMNLPVYESGKILILSPSRARCCIPGAFNALKPLAMVIQSTLETLSQESEDDWQASIGRFAQAVRLLSGHAPGTLEVSNFIKAAYELDIPFTGLTKDIYQYGVARNARWLDATFTDQTPVVAAKLSKSKLWSATMLRRAGLPVPPHRLISNVEECLKVAKELGYPVVVKPANLDRGIGVNAGLESENEVRQAFESAQTHSKQILVEKHAKGRDYRLIVFKGKVINALERVPASITGDGHSTVLQLIDAANADPRRGAEAHSPLKPLIIDDEVSRLLRRQGLNESSVPEAKRFVRLRHVCNISLGGMPIAVHDQVHPENAELAIRAANALQLDLAGIDLIIPDISVTWRKSGAAICEVNSQPNLGLTTSAHLYSLIMRNLMPTSGRVPVIVIVGESASEWSKVLSRNLNEQGMRVGLTNSTEVSIRDVVIHEKPASLFTAGQMLVLNRDVDAIVMAVVDSSLLRSGLPVSRFDVLVLADTYLPLGDSLQKHNNLAWVTELLPGILPACDGVVVFRGSQVLLNKNLKKMTGAKFYESEDSPQQILKEVAELAQQFFEAKERRLAPITS